MIIEGTATSFAPFLCVSAVFLLILLRAPVLSNPATFFACVWWAATVPAVVLAPQAVTPTCLLVVGAFLLSATLGSAIGESLALASSSRASGTDPADVNRFAAVGSTIGGIAGLAAAFQYLAGSGHSLPEFGRLDTWISIAAEYSIARYHEGYVEPILIRLLLAAAYVGALIGGLALASRRSRWHTLAAVLPMSSGVLITLITTAKAPMLLTSLLAISSFLAASAWLRDSAVRLSPRVLVVSVLSIAVVAVGSLGLRYGPEDVDLAVDVAARFESYFTGHLAAFSAWLQWEAALWSTDAAWGRNSFAGAAEVLGLSTRIAGIYAEIPLNPVAAESNVFTALRGLILDFTFPGAILVTACASTAAGFVWKSLRMGRGNVGSVFLLTVYFAFVGWSPIISIFIYNVILLAVALFALFLLLLSWREHGIDVE